MEKEIENSYWGSFFDFKAIVHMGMYTRNVNGKERQINQCLIMASTPLKEAAELLKKTFGGGVRKRKKDHSFNWEIKGKRAGAMVKRIFPYIKVKKELAQLVLDFCETVQEPHETKGNPLATATIEERRVIVERCREVVNDCYK